MQSHLRGSIAPGATPDSQQRHRAKQSNDPREDLSREKKPVLLPDSFFNRVAKGAVNKEQNHAVADPVDPLLVSIYPMANQRPKSDSCSEWNERQHRDLEQKRAKRTGRCRFTGRMHQQTDENRGQNDTNDIRKGGAQYCSSRISPGNSGQNHRRGNCRRQNAQEQEPVSNRPRFRRPEFSDNGTKRETNHREYQECKTLNNYVQLPIP